MNNLHQIPDLEELCIEITGSCLMNCVHCSSSCDSSTTYCLPLVKVEQILSDARSLGTKVLAISGGEPLLHPNLREIITEAKKYFEVRLYSSGYVGAAIDGITKDQAETFAALGLDKIIFSLQGASPIIHESVTGTPGSFRSVHNSIANAKAAGLWVGIHFVPMKPNYRELPALIELCSELRVDEFAVLRFVSQGRGKTNQSALELAKSDFLDLITKIVFMRRDYKDRLNIRTGCPLNFCSLIDPDLAPVRCKAGLSTLLVSFDGRVVPCPAFKRTKEFNLDNVFVSSLQDVWLRSPALERLRCLDCTKIEGCNSCSMLMVCQGRCIAQRYNKHKSIYKGPDPLCPFAKKKANISYSENEDLFIPSTAQ